MGDGDAAFDVVHDEGLAVAAVVRARCAVPHMPDAHVPIRKQSHDVVREDVADKPDVTVVCKKAVVTYDYAAALLSAVLKGKKAVIYDDAMSV